eukprot:TRINITY_DN1499_c0_g2_i1.p1 TRINITY_DN1499_c0_g2~~TRINITY_DN1499_c0_g2_i1.p1  ORF type:complete len:812 (-),score=113.72 TRINITY_DN1499_c0_g2_i1:933-3185(-)
MPDMHSPLFRLHHQQQQRVQNQHSQLHQQPQEQHRQQQHHEQYHEQQPEEEDDDDVDAPHGNTYLRALFRSNHFVQILVILITALALFRTFASLAVPHTLDSHHTLCTKTPYNIQPQHQQQSSPHYTPFPSLNKYRSWAIPPHTAYTPHTRIAVIGAGPAGIFTATTLTSDLLRYTHVDLIEKNHRVGGNAESIFIDGQIHDYSTTFLGNLPKEANVPFRRLMSLFDKYNMGLSEVPSASAISWKDGSLLTGLQWLAGATPETLVGNLSVGYALLEAWGGSGAHHQQRAVDEYAAFPGETLEEWANRTELHLFAKLVGYLVDLFQAGPARLASADYVMRVSYFTAPAAIKALLQSLRSQGVRLEEMSRKFSNSFMRLALHADRTAYYCPVDGYQHFFETLVQREALRVRLNTDVIEAVRDVDVATGKTVWYLNTRTSWSSSAAAVRGSMSEHEHTYERLGPYDMLVVATSHTAAMSFLPSDSPMVPYLAQVNRGRPVRSIFFRAEPTVATATYHTPTSDDHASSLTPHTSINASEITTSTGDVTPASAFSSVHLAIVEPVISAVGSSQWAEHPHAYWRRYPDSNVYQAFSYAAAGADDQDSSREHAYTVLKEDVQRWGHTLTEVIDSRLYYWPDYVPNSALRKGWSEGVSQVQGRGGVYLVGETLAGWTVPAALQYAETMIPQYFPSVANFHTACLLVLRRRICPCRCPPCHRLMFWFLVFLFRLRTRRMMKVGSRAVCRRLPRFCRASP